MVEEGAKLENHTSSVLLESKPCRELNPSLAPKSGMEISSNHTNNSCAIEAKGEDWCKAEAKACSQAWRKAEP